MKTDNGMPYEKIIVGIYCNGFMSTVQLDMEILKMVGILKSIDEKERREDEYAARVQDIDGHLLFVVKYKFRRKKINGSVMYAI